MNARTSAPAALLVLLSVAASIPQHSPAQEAGRRDAPAASPDLAWTHKGVVVFVFEAPPRRAEWEVVVPASPRDVWRAWTEPAELATWAGPAAAVDLRPGGDWHIYFDPTAPEGERGGDASRIVDFVPGRELRLRAGAPREFPTVRREKTDFVVRLEPVGYGHTRILASQSGWKDGDEWDRAFRAITSANAEWLSWLLKRYVEGPIDWDRAGGGQ